MNFMVFFVEVCASLNISQLGIATKPAVALSVTGAFALTFARALEQLEPFKARAKAFAKMHQTYFKCRFFCVSCELEGFCSTIKDFV